ncbi:MAG TPA: DUF4403 family protein [Longimicrobiales bacterium]|nr:DUF4403 family protein [Longimicrobiales bacterium]
MEPAHPEDRAPPRAPIPALWLLRPVGLAAAILFLTAVAGVVYVKFVQAPRIEAPRPVAGAARVRVPEIPPSSLNVPVSYDLSPVIRQLEDLVPRVYGTLDERVDIESNERASVAFELSRAPFRVGLEGNVVRLTSVIAYRARGWYDPAILPEVSASCGTGDDETPPRLVVSLSARLALTEEWRLRARGRIDDVSPATDTDQDRCRITPLRIDVTGRVIGAAQGLLEKHMPDIERAISRIDLGSKFREWWDILQEPIELDRNVWLMIEPIAVSRGSTGGTGRVLVANVALTAHPQLVVGPRPRAERRALPRLDTVQAAEGLHIRATASADYRTGSEMLTRRLGGQVLEQDGRTLEIVALEVSGLGDGRVVVELDFAGSAKGRVFLVGTPHYDAQTGEVHVPDLDFDVASLDLLLGGLDWFAHDQAMEFLRARARWPVTDLTSFAEIQLFRGLNRQLSDEARLRGAVDSVRVIDVYATRESLVVHAEASARAELLVGTVAPSGD